MYIISEKLKIFNTSSALDLWFIIQRDQVKLFLIFTLYPMKQVMWTGLLGSSLGKDFGFPRWRLDLFLGRNPFDP